MNTQRGQNLLGIPGAIRKPKAIRAPTANVVARSNKRPADSDIEPSHNVKKSKTDVTTTKSNPEIKPRLVLTPTPRPKLKVPSPPVPRKTSPVSIFVAPKSKAQIQAEKERKEKEKALYEAKKQAEQGASFSGRHFGVKSGIRGRKEKLARRNLPVQVISREPKEVVVPILDRITAAKNTLPELNLTGVSSEKQVWVDEEVAPLLGRRHMATDKRSKIFNQSECAKNIKQVKARGKILEQWDLRKTL